MDYQPIIHILYLWLLILNRLSGFGYMDIGLPPASPSEREIGPIVSAVLFWYTCRMNEPNALSIILIIVDTCMTKHFFFFLLNYTVFRICMFVSPSILLTKYPAIIKYVNQTACHFFNAAFWFPIISLK